MKKKRLLSVLLSIAMVACAVFSVNTALADDSIAFDYDAETSTLTVIGSGNMENYTENNLNTRPWAAYSESATKVVISEGVTSIGEYAFSRFPALEEVVIPDTVTTIGSTAFGGNDSLLSISVPASVTEIGDYAFGFDFEMYVPTGFIAYCTPNSEAIRYCVKNYIPFECPMVDKAGTAHITAAGQQAMWSFVAPANGTVSFWSTGTKDTYGLIYDASNYSYSTNFSQMRDTAIAKNDDTGSNVNFKVTAKVEAGKRYYLAGKFMLNNRYDGSDSAENGQFGVAYSFTCNEEEHNYTIVDEQASTCEVKGFIDYECQACGYKYTEIPDFAEHTPGQPSRENENAATCTEDGSYDEVVYCDVCDIELTRTPKTITANGHSFTDYVNDDNATCLTNETKTAICDHCDATDTKEIDNSALGHNYVPTVTASTCTEQGYTTYNCSRCEASYVDDYTKPLGHTENEAVEENKVDATCTEDGSYDLVVYCDVCEQELSRKTETITATGHEYAITAFDGITVITSCSKCTGEVTYVFMDWYNVAITEENAEGTILDVNGDGFVNAKDFAKIVKMLAVVE